MVHASIQVQRLLVINDLKECFRNLCLRFRSSESSQNNEKKKVRLFAAVLQKFISNKFNKEDHYLLGVHQATSLC